ncbi:MAG TPA: DinB family protein [Puia sp.]|uniref:DinB family protein n=1 Tax=Puia sp. TaxID=2045100 RepID=UPI002C136D45|nr:DinB family protein [Puia sp.]HVU99631.1 DinB family protein [Puia sp.]
MKKIPTGRRHFIRSATTLTSAMVGLSLLPNISWGNSLESAPATNAPGANAPGIKTPAPFANDQNIIGPKEGYSPQIGTLVSMMAWLRPQVINSIKSLSVEQLDFLLDDKANTIGALAFHLAATDAFYHEHTFKGIEWGKWDKAVEDKFGAAMELGDAGRKKIKGNNADFYINILQQTRESTLAEFKKRDDKWLLAVDEKWYWGPTNNYCKWFHVTEHESHHLGQINLLKSRLPGAQGT